MGKFELRTLQGLVELLPSFGKREAVGLRQEFGLRWWSYERLYHKIYDVARFLRDRKIHPGECILLQGQNCPEWVAFFLGAALRGVIVVPVDHTTSADVLKRIADEVDAKLLIYDPASPPPALPIPSESFYIPNHIPEDNTFPAIDKDLVVPINEDDTALINFTSGTTSIPRGVVITHRNIMTAIAPFQLWRILLRFIHFRLLSVAPLSHILGLMLGISMPLSIGLSVIYTNSINPPHLIRTIRDNRVTLLATVPKTLQLLTKNLLQRRDGRKCLTLEERLRAARYGWMRRHICFSQVSNMLGKQFWVLFIGGADLPIGEERFWRDAGRFLVQGYGLTETTAFMTVNGPFSGRIGSVGKPLSHLNVRIADDGEILVRGPSVTPGYFQNDRANAEVFVDGFFRTGDLVSRDSSNRLYFLGRKKEVIVTGAGQNIYPNEVELVVNQVPGVIDNVILGFEKNGYEEIHAVLLLEPDTKPFDVIQAANSKLQSHQKIQGWSIWPNMDFPRTGLLKIKREEVADFIRSSRKPRTPDSLDSQSLPSLEEILAENNREKRLKLIARYLTETPMEKLDSNKLRLVDDIGLNSMDVVELISILEKRCSKNFDHLAISLPTTVSDLRTIIPNSDDNSSRVLKSIKPPQWAENPVINSLRRLYAPFVIQTWFRLCARLSIRGLEHLAGIKCPFILAGINHHHAMDEFAIYCALPQRMRNKLMIVASKWAFREYLDPSPEYPYSRRLLVAFTFLVGLPALFPFITIPQYGDTRYGLLEICRLIDRGYSPIIFPERFWNITDRFNPVQPGIGLIAAQSYIPIIPVKLAGNKGIDFCPRMHRSRITVSFGEPVMMEPNISREKVIDILEHNIRLML